MTKCITLSTAKNEAKSKEPKKAIEFIYYVYTKTLEIDKASFAPKDCNVVELIKRVSNSNDLDIMFGYDNDRNKGYLYLGHWNDGVV